MAAIVVMTGGGIKGAVAAARYASDHEITFLHLDYGQRSASKEADAVRALAGTFPAGRSLTLDLPHVTQVSEELGRTADAGRRRRARPADESFALAPVALRGLMPVLASTAVQCAIQVGAKQVIAGISRFVDAAHLGLGPTEGQPDRWREFVHSFNVMNESLLPQRTTVSLEVPLIDATYSEIIKLARHFHTPLEKTWTCAQANARPCGRCESCQARAAAFADAGVFDPLLEVAPV